MFHQLIVSSTQRGKRSKSTFFASIVIHAVALSVLVLVPLIYHESLRAEILTFLPVAAYEPPPPPVPPPPAGGNPKQPVNVQLVKTDGFVTPTEIPDKIPESLDHLPNLPVAPGLGEERLPQGVGVGVPGGTGTFPVAPSISNPPPPPPRVKKAPIRQSAGVQQSLLIHRVQPEYPELARRARIQGIVLLQAIVDEEGNVTELKVLSGHPLLRQSAVEAVRQWKYTPTLLSGEPVPVITTVSVIFKLN